MVARRLSVVRRALLAISVLGPACGADARSPADAGSAGTADPAETSERICDPGATQLCFGPGACDGSQICADDGSRWGVCDCAESGEASAGRRDPTGGPAAAGGVGGSAATTAGGDGDGNDGRIVAGAAGGSDSGSSDSGNGGNGGNGGSDGSTSTGGNPGSSSTSSGGRSTGGSSSTPSDDDDDDTSSGPGQECPGVVVPQEELDKVPCQDNVYETEPVPVDLVIMMDRSVSLDRELRNLPGKTRWQAMTEAMEKFVSNAEVRSKDIRVSLQFFNKTGGFIPDVDCAVSSYSTPLIAMDTLDKNGAAIVEKMQEMIPSGQTPTAPALQGALLYAVEWHAQSGGRATAVLFISDGEPTQCQENLSIPLISDMVETYYDPDPPANPNDSMPPSIPTFVVGLGPATSTLDPIALAGGTEAAYEISEDANAVDSLAQVLNEISNAEMSCEFYIPESMREDVSMDYDMNRVLYEPPNRNETQQIPRVASAEDCTGGGWYYVYPEGSQTPERLVVCPCTCNLFRVGTVRLDWGCSPIAP